MPTDVIIIGAGAAGLMTGIQAAHKDLRILMLEGQQQLGAKILMSGGTRCNLTHRMVTEDDFNSQQIRAVRNTLRAFSHTDTLDFFKGLGVDVVLEDTGKYFPSTHSGKTILEALVRAVDRAGVRLLTGHKVQALRQDAAGFKVYADGFEYAAKKVVLTTGGLSYPKTGSDGTGFRLAQALGHSLVPPTPALTPLTCDDQDLKSLSGITVNLRLTLWVEGKVSYTTTGGFLFTHFGFSGPTVLDISRHYVRAKGSKRITVNFMPVYNVETLQARLCQMQQETPRALLRHVLTQDMPQRLGDILFKKAGIDPLLILNQLDRSTRKRLVETFIQYPLDVTGVLGYTKAEVTAGGIDWAGVNPKTLESKLVAGLFFAGEILDVDGRIGGFNFQWAWASGYVVGKTLLKQCV